MTEAPPSFEIRIALIGYVSVGKTTVLNALFGAKYGEVAMKRTTAVVNYFRTSTRTKKQSDDESAAADDADPNKEPKSAATTLAETTFDNALHRNSDTVVEKTYDICLDEPLHRPMRKDTQLVLVDIPGINEAGTSSKYKDYVNRNWHMFDIAVVVMDGRQGVNTDEQVDLIQLAKDNVDNVKDIPVILLINKIDDPHDNDQKVLMDELRTTVNHIFHGNSTQTARPVAQDSPSGQPPFPSGQASPAPSFGQASPAPAPFGQASPAPLFGQVSPASTTGSHGNVFGSVNPGGIGVEQAAAPNGGFVLGAAAPNTAQNATQFSSGKPAKSRANRRGARANDANARANNAVFNFASTNNDSTPKMSPSTPEVVQPSLNRTLHVVPVSAMHAFLYLSGSKLTFESFRQLDREYMDKLGKESYGRQWHRFTNEEKLQKAFAAVSDEEQRRDGIAISNFIEFLQVLTSCIGDEKKQTKILKKQVQIHAERLQNPPEDSDIGAEFGRLQSRIAILGGSQEQLSRSFWIGFNRMADRAFTVFEKGFDTKQGNGAEHGPEVLAILPTVLRSYFRELAHTQPFEPTTKVFDTLERMVWRYCLFLQEWKSRDCQQQSLIARYAVIGSILLLSHDPTFCHYFGTLKIGLEFCMSKIGQSLSNIQLRANNQQGISFYAPNFSCPDCSQQSFITPGTAPYCAFCLEQWATHDMGPGTHCVKCVDGTLEPKALEVWYCGKCSSKLPRDNKTYCQRCLSGKYVARENQVHDSLSCGLCNEAWRILPDPKLGIVATPSLNSNVFRKYIHDPSHYGHFVHMCCSLMHDVDDV